MNFLFQGQGGGVVAAHRVSQDPPAVRQGQGGRGQVQRSHAGLQLGQGLRQRHQVSQ